MAEPDDKSGQAKEEDAPRGFNVTDRRGQPKESPPPEREPQSKKDEGREKASDAADSAREDAPPPPITFTTFIISLSTSALVQLGDLPDPFTKETTKNLAAAQQTIDLLGLLEQKTEGNLNEDEKKALEAVLYDLRMRFLKVSGAL